MISSFVHAGSFVAICSLLWWVGVLLERVESLEAKVDPSKVSEPQAGGKVGAE